MNNDRNIIIGKEINNSRDINIRHSYLCFPKWSQPIWTILTGKALENQKAILNITAPYRLLINVSVMITLSLIFYKMSKIENGSLLLIKYISMPYFILYFTGFFRKLQVVYGHHAIHSNVFKTRKLNLLFSKIFTIISMSQNETEYMKDHLKHHNSKIFTTPHDADANLLCQLEITPSKNKKQLFAQLIKTMFLFEFHYQFILRRIKSNLQRDFIARCAVILWLFTIIFVFPFIFGFYFTIFVLWLPLTLLYHISALLQFTTEHVWLVGNAPGKHIEKYAKRCIGRFCGEVTPNNDKLCKYIYLWIKWWIKTLFIHIPVRMAVLVGDLPVHDWHHLASGIHHSSKNWYIAIYERQRAIDSCDSLKMENRECWGIYSMIDYIFTRMSRCHYQ